jgi:hypothetical protein
MSEPLVDRVCAVCGRTFVPAPYHIFKRIIGTKTFYYCGWNCFHKGEQEPKRRDNGKAKAVDVFATDGEYIRSYSSLKEAHEQTGASITAINNCCRGLTKTTRTGYIFKYKERGK